MRLLRSVLSFLLSVAAAAPVALLFGLVSPALLAAILAAAAVLGTTDRGSEEEVASDPVSTYRLATAWAGYGLIVALTFMMTAFGATAVLPVGVGLLLTLQAAFLARPSIGRRGLPLLTNALALTCLAALAGPPLSTVVIVAHAVLVGLWLRVDQHLAHGLKLGGAWVPALLQAALTAAFLVAVLRWVPRSPSPFGGESPVVLEVSREELFDAFGRLAFWALVGVGLIWLIGRLLDRGKDGSEELDDEMVTALAGDPVPLDPAGLAADLDPGGARGRVVREFVSFLREARRLGFVRRPHWTPIEFARQLPAPAPRLAMAFGKARYGEGPVTDDDAERAEGDAAQVLRRLRGR